MRRLLALSALLLVAADWPQWLGPNRDGSSAEVIKPWTDAPKVLWRARVGEGHSSPVVFAGTVILQTKVPGEDVVKLTTRRASDGQELASATHPRKPYSNQFGAGPRATPLVTPDGQIITYDVTGLLCSEPLPGGPGWTPKNWEVNVLDQFKAPNLTFGVSGSPLLDSDRIVVPVGGKGSSFVAFDRMTGKVAWQTLDDAASYASPIVIDHAGQREIVGLTANGVVGVSAKDGSLFWRFPFKDLLAESSTTPVKVGDLLIASSVTLGSIGLKLTTVDGKPAVEQAWKNPQLPCYFSTPVAVGKDHVYMVTGSLAAIMRRQPQADLCCVETATGKLLWKKEKVGKYHAALLRTGDNKLLMSCDSGDLVLIDPDAKEYRELARSKVCGETWAHPALADGRLYVRDDKELICLKMGE
jgi:outer membrane protein assembly factor BamB